MERREFIALLGGAACSLSRAREARSNPSGRMRRVGVLMGGAEHDLDWPRLEAAIEQELKNLGWTRGRDMRIDWRWPGNDIDRIKASAIELVELGPDVIVTAANDGVQALRSRTDSVPIVFVNAADPVGNGFVSNLARPGGNITGFAASEYTISQKWLELAKEIAPRTARFGIVFNPDTAPIARNFLKPLEAAAPRANKPVSLPFKSDAEIEQAIEAFGRAQNGALLIMPDVSTALSRRAIIDTANRLKLPAVYPFRFFALDGGLVSYNIDLVEQCKGAAGYVDKILRGQSVGELPVQPASKYELVVNLKAAKALNITLPQAVLSRASEIIE